MDGLWKFRFSFRYCCKSTVCKST